MKKLILILVVLAMAAPLYAAGRVQFVATDNEDGTCTITFDANDVIGIVPVAMGLDVKVTGSDPCHAITAVSGMDSFFEIFMDYAYDDPCSYTYGAGNPVADPCAAGSLGLPSHHFCVSMGGLGGETDPDEKAAPDNGVAFVLTAGNLGDPCDTVTGHIKINALRGGVIGKDTDPMETNLVPVHLAFTITNAPTFFPPACDGDFDGSNAINTSDISLVVTYWFNNKNFFGQAPVGTHGVNGYLDGMDMDCSGAINTSDISMIVTYWFNTKNFFGQAPCPSGFVTCY